MNQPIFEKITKLLRKAERATGPEAELCLLKAQQFAVEHQIDLATINTSEGETEQKESFDTGDVAEGGKKPLRRFILWILQNHFRVKGVVWSYNHRINLIGRKSDVVFAQYLFLWLMEHFQREWRNELKNGKSSRDGSRRSQPAFYYGMYQGLNQKLEDAKRETEDSRISQVATTKTQDDDSEAMTVNDSYNAAKTELVAQYQLAIITEKDALEEEYYRLHPSLRNRRGSSCRVNHNALSMAAGRKAGARIRLPGIPLNNSTRSALA